MGRDRIIDFESNNWNDLAEQFIKKNQDKWDEFVMEQYEGSLMDCPDEDDGCILDDSKQA